MPTLNIEGRSVTVGDDFLKLSPEQQNATVEEIHSSLGASSKPEPSFDRNDPRFTSMTAKAAIQGIPVLGAAEPYLAAAANTVAHPFTGVGHADFATNLAEHKAANEAFDKEHPIESGASKMVGGALALAPLGATALGAKALGLTGETLAARAGAGALSGAGIGGADAVAHGDNPTAGAVIGGALGAGAPVIAKGIGAGVQALRSSAPEIAGSASPKVARAMASDSLDAHAVEKKLTELGPEATLADLGPNLRGQAEAIASAPGAGQKKILDAMGARTEGAGGRIEQALDQHLGPSVNPTELTDQIIARRKATAAPLYEEAYKSPITTTPEIEEVLNTPMGQIALQKARKLAQNDTGSPLGMFETKQKTASIPSKMTAAEYQDWLAANASGKPVERSVDVRGLDLTKRALDDMIDVAQRKGANNQARVAINLRDKLVKSVDQQAPKFAEARDVFSTESGIKDAIENGRKVFSRTMSPDELGATLRGMSGAEHDAFTQGARSAVADIMGSARNDAGAARALFQKGWTREKLDTILGKPTTEALFQHLEREGLFHETASGITGNSRTAARLAAGKEFPNSVSDPKFGRHGTTAIDLAAYVPRKIAGALVGKQMRERAAKLSSDAADALVAKGPARDEIVRKLLEAQAAKETNAAKRAQLERVIASTIRGGGEAVSH
jgi:hypothetical protein